VVAHSYNPSTQEIEAGGSLVPGLHSETLSQKENLKRISLKLCSLNVNVSNDMEHFYLDSHLRKCFNFKDFPVF
jgi:hypothetical protein